MASKHQMTGMLGVYLAAAELTHKGLVVSVTSRSAKGADLLAADQSYQNTWSIQVKTNSKAAAYWLLNRDYKSEVANSHIYIFVNIRGDQRPDYYVVPSKVVSKRGRVFKRPNSIWYAFFRDDAPQYKDNWGIFEARLNEGFAKKASHASRLSLITP
jgi:hypothetical protein